MNLSRPDRRERLDRLAAEFALGTSTSRVRRQAVGDRHARSRRRGCADRVGATAGRAGRRRTARHPASARLGASRRTARTRRPFGSTRAPARWWGRAGRLARADGGRFRRRPGARSFAAGAAARASCSTHRRRSRGFGCQARADCECLAQRTVPDGQGRGKRSTSAQAACSSCGHCRRAAHRNRWASFRPARIVQVPLAAPADESLTNIPALAVSLEPPGGSPTGAPTGPVLYSGSIERMY